MLNVYEVAGVFQFMMLSLQEPRKAQREEILEVEAASEIEAAAVAYVWAVNHGGEWVYFDITFLRRLGADKEAALMGHPRLFEF